MIRFKKKTKPAANSVLKVFGLMTHLEFLTLFGSFNIVGQENVSNSQTQQIRETLAKIVKYLPNNMTICFTSIGTIHTPFKRKEGMPIQSTGSKGIRGTIKLKRKYVEGLLDLEKFSHIILVYYFHKSNGFNLQVIPFLDDKPHGLFATRAPKRPNAIGISVVKLLSIKDNILDIENVDMLDGTPLLDIKPYISQFDIHEIEKSGWINHKTGYPNEVKSDDRFN